MRDVYGEMRAMAQDYPVVCVEADKGVSGRLPRSYRQACEARELAYRALAEAGTALGNLDEDRATDALLEVIEYCDRALRAFQPSPRD